MKAPLLRATRDTIRYGFASGKARVLETRVFGRSTFERLLDAPTFTDQKRVLSETPYGRYLEGVETSEAVERAMLEALDGFYRFLSEADLPEPVVRFFRVRHDFAAMRAAWKARVLGLAYEPQPYSLGTVDETAFAAAFAEWPEPFASIVADAAGTGEDEPPGASAVDAAVDRALFAEMARCAKDSHSEFLRGLTARLADIANARALVRSRVAGHTAREAETGLVPGGGTAPAVMMEMYARAPAELAERLALLPSLRGVTPAELSDPSRFDVVTDDLVVRYLRQARAVPVGPEPVIAYVLAREAEVASVRTMLMGRLAGLPTELLRERLRESHGSAR